MREAEVSIGDEGYQALEPLAEADREQSVPDCLEPRLEMFADRIAVADQTGAVTYRELNRRANQIAHWLHENDNGGTGPIALMLVHGAPFLAGALAALKLGRPYVGLHPGHPPQRNRDILADTRTAICLTDSPNAEAARTIVPHPSWIWNIDDIAVELPDHNLGLEIRPTATSAIFYTTGTTGTPKGVEHGHRDFLAAAHDFIQAFGITPDDRVLLVRHTSTIASVKVVFGALLSGSTLCPWYLGTRGAGGLAHGIDTQMVSICYIPSNIFRRLVASVSGSSGLPSVRIVILTSDGASHSDVDLWKRHFPNSSSLVHQIACNEVGVYRRYVIDRSTKLPGGAIPVGFPVDGKDVVLWDERGNQVACGEVGEIVVKSRYLAKGYWNRPDLTREAFLGAAQPNEPRLYRTGDMGRLSRDGCLHVVGRNDGRVKILGNRVEIGEVEAALLGLDGIDEAAVVVQDNGARGGEIRLAAYFVSHGNAPSVAAIRTNLAEALVRSMIPTKLVRLDAIPRTTSGKIDRQSLAAMDPNDRGVLAKTAPPRDELERAVVRLLEDVLQVAPIGIDDDLLALGGDSLIAVELFIAIEKEFGVALPIDTLWSEAQTVSELARVVRNGKSDGTSPQCQKRELQPGDVRGQASITRRDAVEVALLLLLSLVRWTIRPRYWRRTARALAWLVMLARPRHRQASIRAIDRMVGDHKITLSSRALASERQAALLERRLLRLNGWYPEGSSPPLTIEGREHIDRALEEGKGAILWRAPFIFNGLATKLAVNRLGYPASVLGRPEHGFSSTAFGQRFLNRFSRDNEGCLAVERIHITGDGRGAFERIRRRLAQNRIVIIRAGHQTDDPVELPLFAGRMRLSGAGASLALATGAALLPTFTIRDEEGGFLVVIEPPLEVDTPADTPTVVHALLSEYAALFEPYLQQDPAAWPNWWHSAASTGGS